MKTIKSRTLGQRVRAIREEYGLSQSEFGSIIEKSHVAVGNIETGTTETPQMGTLKAIAEKFGTTVEWLIKEEGEVFPKGKIDPSKLNGSKVSDPWKDEAYQNLKEELKKAWAMVEFLSGGKINFLKPLNEAAIIPLNAKEAEVVALRGRAVANG